MKNQRTLLLLSVFFLVTASALAQVGMTERDLSKLGSQQTGSMGKINADASDILNQMGSSSFSERSMPIEGAIEPSQYIVGPNDLFTLGFYGYIDWKSVV